jgi:putative intracellular protease/amidase
MKSLSIGLALPLVASIGVATSVGAIQEPAAPRQNVAVLLFPGVQIIDYSAPYEVFSQAGVYNIFTVAESSAPISTSGGPGAATVTARYTFANHPKPDIVIIPGGGGSRPGDGGVGNQTANPAVIRWIQDQAGSAGTVLSVCNGAFLLAKAGLLDGLEATTFWGMLDDLKVAAPRTRVHADRRYVDNGKVITTAGLSSGIDGSLYVLSKLHGAGKARQVALQMEYDWRPESTFARGGLADMALWKVGINHTLLRVLKGKTEVTEGNTTQWNQVVTVSGKSPAEVLSAIEAGIDSSSGWRAQAGSGNAATRRAWTYTDDAKTQWTTALDVSPNSKTPSATTVRVKVSSSGSRTS